MRNILIIDDEINTCTLLGKILARKEFNIESTLSGYTGMKMLKEKPYDLVFCDYRLKDKEMDGASMMETIHSLQPGANVVIMTGYPDVRIAIKMIKEGAFEYLIKPFNREQILTLTSKMLPDDQSANIESPLSEPAPVSVSSTNETVKRVVLNRNQPYIFGESEASKELYDYVNLVAPTDYSVVITGETGVGKEAIARLLHLQSKRRDHPFIALDCGCLSEELAASELFGHEKGAFTGAINTVKGAFEQAQGGTLFLDEITNLSYAVQVALLRVIQERIIKPVGSLKVIPVDIRLVVASNESLSQAVAAGRFREDLYYRLNEFSITVPPLRRRLTDLPLFITSFLKEIGEEIKQQFYQFSDSAMEYLYQYNWPGNIRELKNVIRRACLLTAAGEKISAAALPPELLCVAAPIEQETISITLPEAFINLKTVSRQAEYQKILSVMKEVRYNKTRCAKLLNIDRKTLYNKLSMFNILL